jgi:hypothetical protein
VAKAREAVDIWNAMAGQGTIHTEKLDPQCGLSLTNGDLKRPFERVGFDWYLPHAEGVAQNHFVDAGEIRFDFSGDQPEGVLVFYQSLPVVGGAAYRLTFRYRTAEMEHADGLYWQAWDYAGQRVVPVAGRLAVQPDWAPGEASFTVTKGVSIVRLGLVYQRASGSTRIRGTAAFSAFALQERAPK